MTDKQKGMPSEKAALLVQSVTAYAVKVHPRVHILGIMFEDSRVRLHFANGLVLRLDSGQTIPVKEIPPNKAGRPSRWLKMQNLIDSEIDAEGSTDGQEERMRDRRRVMALIKK